ncbi:MAG: OmpH family outer membrane protein [Sphingomonadales bacterium]|nr:OmpH family outer membrane protein [Sphingomonadales bacterium]
MTIFHKSLLGAGLVLALAAQPALAKDKPAPEVTPAPTVASSAGPIVPGLGIADLEAVLLNTNAVRVGDQQRPVTYKATIDQYQARGQALQAQLQAMSQKLQKDAQAPGASQTALQQQAAAIQKLQETGKAELNTIIKPVAYSQEYVKEQVEEKLDQAVKAVMARKNVTLLLSPQSVILTTAAAYDLNQDIVNELNTAIPNATLTPPAGWEPRQIREARAQQAAQQAGASAPAPRPATKPAGPQPDSR